MAIVKKKKKKKPIKLSDKDIVLAMTDKGRPCALSSHLVVSNVSWGFKIHECDMISVTNSGYATEIEIKISVADTKKDMTKAHGHKSDKIKYLYFAMPKEIYEKAKEFVPKQAGIYTVEAYYWRKQLRYRVVCERKAEVNQGHRKLTDDEIDQLRRLAAMRYFSMLKRYVREKRRRDEG